MRDLGGGARLGSPRTWLLLLCLTACGDGPTDPVVPVIVTISPTGATTLNIGDTVTVRATVQNTEQREVTFSTSNGSVATVDAVSGLVRAVGAGTATITATSVAVSEASASVDFRVERDRPTSVVITSISDAAGLPVDPESISGLVNVNLAVERGSAARLEVRVDTAVVCEQTFAGAAGTGSSAVVSVVCPVNTASIDSLGVPRLFNGPAVLSARLLAANERVLSSAGGRQVVLANANRLISRVSAARQANDAAGLRWVAGDVLVSVSPVMFDRNTGLSRVEVAYRSPAGATVVRADTAAPFAVTIAEKDGPLNDLTDPAFRLSITSATTSGSVGPSGTTTPFRYDTAEPAPGKLVPREWIGELTRFATTYDPAGQHDAGVGRVHPRFFAGDPSLGSAELVAAGKEVVQGGDLPQAARGSYRLALKVCDALENCVVRDGFLFGVDLSIPTVDTVSVADRAVNPQQDLVFQLRDDLSGVGVRPLEVSTQLLDASPVTATCGPDAIEGLDLPGRLVASTCVPDTTAAVVPVPRATPGYYTYQVVPFDRAGNRGAVVTRRLLVDLQAPLLGTITIPAQLMPGEEATITAEVTDNLDLTEAAFRLVYPLPSRLASLALPFAAPTTIGAAFDLSLTTSASAAGKLPFVRSLTYGSATAGARVTVVVDSLQVVATDAALLTAASSRRIAASSFGSDTSVVDPFTKFTTMAALPDRAEVCTLRCGATDPTAVRVMVRVVGEGTGPVAPFARVHLYRRGEDGVVVHIGSISGTPTSTIDTGTQTTFSYAFPEYSPPAGLSGRFTLLAVGVSSRGNALITDLGASPVQFYRR